MNRLTKRDPYTGAACEIDGVDRRSITARLAAYEDTGLEPKLCADYAKALKEGRYIILKEREGAGVARLREIAEADVEGRLVVLPCKVGDTVFRLTRRRNKMAIVEPVVSEIILDGYKVIYKTMMHGKPFEKYDSRLFAVTVFLTREEAEAALRKEQGDDQP